MSSFAPIVVLDPGHGGAERVGGSSPLGAAGAFGLIEKDVALDLCQRVEARLLGQADVRLTRDSDRNLPLTSRARIARDGAAAVFLSLHLNQSADAQLDGVESWVARDAGRSSKSLAAMLAARVADAAAIPNRGVRHRDLGGIASSRHHPDTAACLLEVAYLSHPDQARNLTGARYRDELASAVASAVLEHLDRAASARAFGPALGSDEPLDARRALLYSTLAPLAPKAAPKTRAEADQMTVLAQVNTGFSAGKPDALVFFHGHNNYVTAEVKGGAVVRRAPAWVFSKHKNRAQWNSGSVPDWFSKFSGSERKPLVLAPEDGSAADVEHKETNKDTGEVTTWYTWANNDGAAKPFDDKSRLGALVDDCVSRLAALSVPGGSAKYIAKKFKTADIKRLYLVAHSGGGELLRRAAASTIGAATAVELVLLDSAYSSIFTAYTSFLQSRKSRLGRGPDESRLIAVYGDTRKNTLKLLAEMTSASGALKFTVAKADGAKAPATWPATDIIHFEKSAPKTDVVAKALEQPYKAIFIHDEQHNSLPPTYVPLILSRKC